MRLPIVISVGLVFSINVNALLMSQIPIQVAQSLQVADSNLLQQLRINRRLWKQQKISNYSYTLTRHCECLPEATQPVVIEVRNGITTNITYAANGQQVNSELFQKYNTIPKLFNLISTAILDGAFSFTIQYDSTLGYPTQINIYYNSQIADDELSLTINDLKEIQ